MTPQELLESLGMVDEEPTLIEKGPHAGKFVWVGHLTARRGRINLGPDPMLIDILW